MTQTLALPEPSVAAKAFAATDRCDRCGAQAYTHFVRGDLVLTKGEAALFMCAHHTKRHADALRAQGFLLVGDQTHLLHGGNRQQGDAHA